MMSSSGFVNPRSRTVGRFAPSPTGDLHFGSLLAAVASYLQSKQSGGKWLVRVEDIDPPREVAGSAAGIIQELSRFGMIADDPVLFQSQRIQAYHLACRRLLESGQAYWCGCSRSDLPLSGIYPGTCRNGIPRGRKPRSIRIRVDTRTIQFHDRVQGEQSDKLEDSVGDFVIRRADGLFAYQLAVVVDDAFQNITEVVRGADLLDSTARQIHLQNCLGLPTPSYAHVPVAVMPDGLKLSKSTRSDPIRCEAPATALRLALAFLGHSAPRRNLAGIWDWAFRNWSLDRVPKLPTRRISGTATQSRYNAQRNEECRS
jgi:glutamyl-Q tRNA(Asp) synthetase